jgi:hypothetical protein
MRNYAGQNRKAKSENHRGTGTRGRQFGRGISAEFDANLNRTYTSAARKCVRLMKTNITLKLDTSLLREIRILAAEEGTSISAMLAARLEQIVRERKNYDRSRRRALARLRDGMSLGWTPPRSRDELYER